MGKGDWGPLSSPHATPPQGHRAPGLGAGPLGPAIPPKPPTQERGTEEGRKGHTDHFLFGKTEMEGGRRTSTYPTLPHLREQKTERAVYREKQH